MTLNTTTILSRRGSQCNLEGKSWEHIVADCFPLTAIDQMNNEALEFIKPILIEENLALTFIDKIFMEVIPGTGKSDIFLHVVFIDKTKKQVSIPIQLKSLSSRTQFSLCSANNFTALFGNEYPLAAVGFQKMVGYGQYAGEAQLVGAGGYLKNNIPCDYRFLIEELSVEERTQIKNMLEDPVMLRKVSRWIVCGDGIIQPKYCIFPKKKQSIHIKDWKILKYDNAIDMMIHNIQDSCSIGLQTQIIPMKKGNKNTKSITTTYFNFKMYYASQNTTNGHRLQIMGTPNMIFNDVEIWLKKQVNNIT